MGDDTPTDVGSDVQPEFLDELTRELAEDSGTPEPTPEPEEAPTVEDDEEGVESPPTPVTTPPVEEQPKPTGEENPAPPTEPQYATREDVKEAMREYNQETQEQASQHVAIRDDIIKAAYPQGVDQNVYDSDGKIIKTAQDIVDRELVNERTGDVYTYEEAASFMLQAAQKQSENMEELTKWADNVADINMSLADSSRRVMEQHGDILSDPAHAEMKDRLAKTYIETQVKFDETGQYVTQVAMLPEDFYAIALGPYRDLAAASAQKAAEEAAAAKSQQQERNGLPPQRGTSDTKANTGDPMLDALLDELKKED